jgi:hypothetical protein
MTITAAGMIQITLPSIASFTSAVINFALNAPAVGTNFPLNIDSANLSNSGITGLTGTAATTAVTAGSGKIGETVTASLSDVALTSTTAANAGSLSLSTGVWTVYYKGCFDAAAISSITSVVGSISTTSTTQNLLNQVSDYSTNTGLSHFLPTAVTVLNLLSTTTVYAVITATFSATTPVSKANRNQFFAIRIA